HVDLLRILQIPWLLLFGLTISMKIFSCVLHTSSLRCTDSVPLSIRREIWKRVVFFCSEKKSEAKLTSRVRQLSREPSKLYSLCLVNGVRSNCITALGSSSSCLVHLSKPVV
ncbi:unnamed protein product, partial [Musa banksii]